MLPTVDRNKALAKLEELIAQGKQQAGHVIEHVQTNQPTDRLVQGADMVFRPADKGVVLSIPERSDLRKNGDARVDQELHRNAIYQIATQTDMPVRFIDSLDVNQPWSRALLAHNLQTILNNSKSTKRFLLRSLNGQVRGFLSDSYRRIDSRPIIEAFAKAVQARGAVPYAGYVTDTKICIQAVMPEVFEVAGDVVAYGISLENSDFGNGAVSLREDLLRIWCTNLHIFYEMMRQIHLGRRLDERAIYSQKTYELDARTTVSALSDIINRGLNKEQLQQKMELVKTAAEQKVDPAEAQALLKKLLQKQEVEDVTNAYNSLDQEMMPAGNNMWRLSNAISWVATKTDDAEKKLELSKIAGQIITPKQLQSTN